MTKQDNLFNLTEKNIRLMAVVRYIIILLGIGFLLIRHPRSLTSIAVLGPYIIFVIGAIFNTVYVSLLMTRGLQRHFYVFVVTQIIVDALLISGLVFFTGGIFSAITSFYFAVILTASVYLARRDALFFASLCIILFSIIHILYALKFYPALWEPSWHLEIRPNLAEIVSKLMFHAAAFYTVAILSGTLANILRSVRILNVEILENISEGLLVVDNRQRVTFVNDAFCQLFDLTPAKVQAAANAEDLFPDHERIRSIISRADTHGGEYSLGKAGPDPARELNIKVSELIDRQHEFKGLVILFEDITSNKDMEKALLRIDRYRALVEMSAGIAHEIRNPLASIRGCAEELAKEEDLGDANRKLFNIIKEESDRLTNIISDFYNYLRESPPDKQEHNLRDLVNDTIEVARQSPVFKNITFTNEIAEDLTALIDRDQWKQVMLNLFLNATEAMSQAITVKGRSLPPDEVAFARKFVSLEEIARGIELTVADTGQGISMDKISNIFIPFYTTKDEGIGVGLSVVNRIIRSHGGIIEAQSAIKAGTTFRIILPIYKEKELT